MGICVFWYPVKNEIPFNDRFRCFETEQLISDFGSLETYLKISITHWETSIEEARLDGNLIERTIIVECYKKESNGEKSPIFTTFTLEHKSHSRNGMVVYEYEEPKNYPQGGVAFEKFLTGVCYHHVKSLFHNHEVQSDRDNGLVAYLAEGNFDINSITYVNNDVIRYYIKQYESIFLKYAEIISKRLQVYDAIELKINKYKYLVLYGWKDFWRWFSDPKHQDEVETLKKDILKWSLFLNPHNKISRNLNSYVKRIKQINKSIIKQIENGGKRNLDLLNKIQFVTEFVRGKIEHPYYKFYRYELEPINTVLNEIEIELGIYKYQYNCEIPFYVYRQLRKLILDMNELSRNTNFVLFKLCESASVEYSYCKTLLESPFNWSIKKDNYAKSEYNDRRSALNIRNSIRYIETVKEGITHNQINNIFSILEKADNVSQTSTKISYLGLAITSLSLIISLIFANRDYSNKSNQVPKINSDEVVNFSVIKCDTVEQRSLFDYRSERGID